MRKLFCITRQRGNTGSRNGIIHGQLGQKSRRHVPGRESTIDIARSCRQILTTDSGKPDRNLARDVSLPDSEVYFRSEDVGKTDPFGTNNNVFRTVIRTCPLSFPALAVL